MKVNTRMRYYVGLRNGARFTFSAIGPVTEETHGDRFGAVIGPFRTKRGAQFMAVAGAGNPHCLTVADAERIAREVSRIK